MLIDKLILTEIPIKCLDSTSGIQSVNNILDETEDSIWRPDFGLTYQEQYITVTLEETCIISHIEILFHRGDKRHIHFAIRDSMNKDPYSGLPSATLFDEMVYTPQGPYIAKCIPYQTNKIDIVPKSYLEVHESVNHIHRHPWICSVKVFGYLPEELVETVVKSPFKTLKSKPLTPSKIFARSKGEFTFTTDYLTVKNLLEKNEETYYEIRGPDSIIVQEFDDSVTTISKIIIKPRKDPFSFLVMIYNDVGILRQKRPKAAAYYMKYIEVQKGIDSEIVIDIPYSDMKSKKSVVLKLMSGDKMILDYIAVMK